MLARQVMSRPVVTIPADATVFGAAEILLGARISGAPVVDADGRMIGMVSEADLMNRPEIGTVPARSLLQRLLGDETASARDYIRSHSHHVADVMTRDVVSAAETLDLREVAALMQRHGVRRIPIVKDGQLVGIVSRANLLKGLLSRLPLPGDGEVPDDTVRAAVQAELERQDWSARATTSVVVDKGVVHLWGHCNDQVTRTAVAVAAETVHGVRRVVNNLVVLDAAVRRGL